MDEEKRGRGRPAGSKNKTPAQGRKTLFQSMSVSGKPEEIAALKKRATSVGKSVSRLVLDALAEGKL